MVLEPRILIVDDDANIRDVLEALLHPEGYELSFACNGPEALVKAAELTPDLILLDVMMPGMDGFEVCQRLRADSHLAKVPIVMITALDDRTSMLQGIKVGADDFLPKPFDSPELQARIRTITRLNRYRRLLMERTQREQAEEALAMRATQLALLNETSSKIAAVLELDALLNEAAGLVQAFGYPHVALFTLDGPDGELQFKAGAGAFANHLPPTFSIQLDLGLVGRVGDQGEYQLANDTSTDPRYVSFFPDKVPIQSELAVPLKIRDEVVGVLDVQSPRLDAFDENDVMVMETLADQIATSIQNARLYGAERAARKQLRDLAGYLETAREKERTHIAREIHDEFGQALTALKMDLAWLTKRLPQDDLYLQEKLQEMSDLLDSTITTVRRIATELRPGLLDHLGLVAAIEWQAQEIAKRANFDCELWLGEDTLALDPDLSTAIFRIFQETLTNVARHAGATKVWVELQEDCEELVLVVRDNGRGMTMNQTSGPTSLGLVGMQERARSWGGTVNFQGTPGQGTTVTVRMPKVCSKEGRE